MTARLSKADQVIPQGIHTVIPFFSLYEKDVYVLIPVFPRLDFKVVNKCGRLFLACCKSENHYCQQQNKKMRYL